MSKNELRSSGKRRRRDFANGAGGISRTEFHACMRICPRDAANGAGGIPKTQSFLFIPKYSKIN